MNKKNGFTLVELLAVIVILAVILVIAVPSIISTITESRKGVLASSAKLIASSAESMKISNQALGIDSEITCADVANIPDEDYECRINVLGGKPYVSLTGKGKFEGMCVLLGTKENAETIMRSNCNPTAVEKITAIASNVSNTEGIIKDTTNDHNIRYMGSMAKNYVEFGNDNELWRIIGIFNVMTADGKTKELMKIVRDSSIEGYAWDVSDSGVNNGYGINQWGPSTHNDENKTPYEGADLMVRLNNSYLNRTGDFGDAKTVKGIDSTSRNMIESVVWNTGAIKESDTLSPQVVYESERGEIAGKICSNPVWCNDNVIRTLTWTGTVGLIYPSDYAYASSSCNNIKDTLCGTNNWLHNDTTYWTLSPYASQGYSRSAFLVYENGSVYQGDAHWSESVRPSVYLKSNISITSGEGTEQSPYKLNIS